MDLTFTTLGTSKNCSMENEEIYVSMLGLGIYVKVRLGLLLGLLAIVRAILHIL